MESSSGFLRRFEEIEAFLAVRNLCFFDHLDHHHKLDLGYLAFVSRGLSERSGQALNHWLGFGKHHYSLWPPAPFSKHEELRPQGLPTPHSPDPNTPSFSRGGPGRPQSPTRVGSPGAATVLLMVCLLGILTLPLAQRPKVSGWYISSALMGGTSKCLEWWREHRSPVGRFRPRASLKGPPPVRRAHWCAPSPNIRAHRAARRYPKAPSGSTRATW